MLLVTGAFMIFSLLSFSTVKNSLMCPIQFGTAILRTGYGGSFWLMLAIGKDNRAHHLVPLGVQDSQCFPPTSAGERAWGVQPTRAPACALAKQILAGIWRGLAEAGAPSPSQG